MIYLQIFAVLIWTSLCIQRCLAFLIQPPIISTIRSSSLLVLHAQPQNTTLPVVGKYLFMSDEEKRKRKEQVIILKESEASQLHASYINTMRLGNPRKFISDMKDMSRLLNSRVDKFAADNDERFADINVKLDIEAIKIRDMESELYYLQRQVKFYKITLITALVLQIISQPQFHVFIADVFNNIKQHLSIGS